MHDVRGVWRGWALLAVGVAAGWAGSALSQPASLNRHTAIYDPVRSRMVVYGGYTGTQATSDTWQLSLSRTPQWSPLASQGDPPPSRVGHSAVYDPVRDRMIVFGGLDSLFTSVLNDVWALTLSDPPTWSNLQPTGTPPGTRRYQSAIYDPIRDRVVIFGGSNIAAIPMRDVWSLWLTPTPHWEQLSPAGVLPSRFSHSAIYDPVRDRMLVYGGGLPILKDVWALSLGDTPAWTKLLPPVVPSTLARLNHSAIYDPLGDRMVVFGGDDGSAEQDVWTLSLTADPAWSVVPFTGETPTQRESHTAVLDAPSNRMIAFGGGSGTSSGVSEPTWALSLGEPMRWSPLRPLISVSPGALHFAQAVTIGDTVSLPFVVSNIGLLPLDVTGFALPPLGARLNAPDPFQLAWSLAATESLFLAPSVPGNTLDSLVIMTNDPNTPRRQVEVSVAVLGLDFDAHVLGEPAEAPLGDSLIVVVTPKPGVRVERGTLHYAIDDGTSPFVPLPLTVPYASDFIATIPASAVTEHGVKYYVTVENSGFTATLPAGAPGSVFTQPVAHPASIHAIARPVSGTEILSGRAIEVEVSLPAGAVFGSGTLHYRRGGDQAYISAPLAPGDAPSRPVAIIPESVVGPRGVEYWVEVSTLTATLRFPAVDPAVDVVRTRVQDLAEALEHPAARYRLLSVPLDFGTFSGSLDALLTDQLGPYDPVHWRAFAYDAALQQNLELSSGSSVQLQPVPGRGFWLISLAPHQVDTKPVDGLSTLTGVDYSISLKAGWNLFGDPFDFPVEWSAVLRDPLIVGDPVAFDPTRGAIGDYADGTPSVLQPFEGYFIHANQATTIQVPPVASPSPAAGSDAPLTAAALAAAPPSPRKSAGDEWRFRLRAWSDRAEDASNEFGVNAAAELGSDALDQHKPPPPPGRWVQAAFAHADWGDRSGSYRRDLRAPGSAGERWEIEVQSSVAGDPVTLDLSEIVPASSGLALRVIDREQGTVADGFGRATDSPAGAHPALPGERSVTSYRIVSFGPHPYHLTIVAGTEEYVAEATREALAVPTRMTLDPNAPNPFRAATRIRFGLPRAERVSLEIYSVLGQRVSAPLEHAPLDAGYHTIVWDGQTSHGGTSPSGVYLLRLTVGADVLTERLVRIQ